MTELKEAIQSFSADLEAFKQRYGERVDALANDVDDLLVRANRPGGGGGWADPIQGEHKQAFEAWLRDPRSAQRQMDLAGMEQRSVTVGVPAGGGYAVPEAIDRDIREKLRLRGGIANLVRRISVSSSDFKVLTNVKGAASGWVGEGDTRNETATSQLAETALTFGTLYAYPKASEESLQDIMFDVGAWLTRDTVEEFAIQISRAIIAGNGTKKPTGFLNAEPVAIPDDDDISPARPFGTCEYIATGVADGFGSLSTGSPEHFPADVLLATVYALNAGYRANATWVMSSSTAGTIRKFKDADGRYLWVDPIAQGQPPLLCGYPVTVDEHMPSIGANAHPIAFGDFAAAYTLADLGGLRITLDDNITTPGQVKFYIRQRLGGALVNDDAIKVIKCAAS